MCVYCHVCHTQAQSCLSTGWTLNRCLAWVSLNCPNIPPRAFQHPPRVFRVIAHLSPFVNEKEGGGGGLALLYLPI